MRLTLYDVQKYGSLIEKAIQQNNLDVNKCTLVVSKYLKSVIENYRAYVRERYPFLFTMPMKTRDRRKYLSVIEETENKKTEVILIKDGEIVL